jgi:SAM-dependent methyltransferase
MSTILFRDLGQYRAAQIVTNARKLQQIFACEAELQAIADDVLANCTSAAGCCHGARNGYEVQALRHLLGDCEVLGTDIAPTAWEHGLIQMDFHAPPAAWSGRFDFVYSNSLDHAHSPAAAVAAWVKTLRPNGRLYLSHCRNSTYAQNLADCYGATLAEYEALVSSAAKHEKTIWIGDCRNASSGLVRDLAIVVGVKP